MQETTLDIINKLGLHARAASKLTATCTRYKSRITFSKITNDVVGNPADGKSIMALMLLAAGKGTQLHVRSEGDDETAAMDAVTQLFAERFGESE